MRLVDADALDNMLADAQTECKRNGGNFRFGVLSTVRENIKTIPTVDAAPVVRCLDCKWFDCKNYVCNNDILAGRIADCGCYPNFNVESDWFCADGERRDSE